MAKKASKGKITYNKLSSGWAFSLASMVLALIFLMSVINNSLHKIAHRLHPAPLPYLLVGVVALLAAVLSIKWEKKAHLVAGLSVGVVAASLLLWSFGLH